MGFSWFFMVFVDLGMEKQLPKAPMKPCEVEQQLVATVAGQLGSVSSRRPPPEVLIPAVERWLKMPNGQVDEVTTSSALIALLLEEVNPEELMKQQGHAGGDWFSSKCLIEVDGSWIMDEVQDFTSAVAGHHVTAPVQKLFGDLDALSPTQGAFVCPIQRKLLQFLELWRN